MRDEVNVRDMVQSQGFKAVRERLGGHVRGVRALWCGDKVVRRGSRVTPEQMAENDAFHYHLS